MKSTFKVLALAAAVAVAPFTATPALAEGEKYILVSHAPDSDSWWNTIKNGIALAGKQVGAEVEYRNPPTGEYNHHTGRLRCVEGPDNRCC